MSRIRYDQLFKQHLEEFLETLGRVERSYEIPGEPLSVDIWFQPDEVSSEHAGALGLLGEMAKTASVIEPYYQPPDDDELLSCVYKQIHVRRQMKREQRDIAEEDLPQLWILAPTLSKDRLKSAGAKESQEYGEGVYDLASLFRSHIIVIHQLPETSETVWLRVIGKGQVQQRAIAEIMQMPVGDERRETALRVLSNWKVISEQVGVEGEEDEAFVMALSQAFLELEQKIEQRGIERGRQEGREEGREAEACSFVLRLLTRRFGSIAEVERSQITVLTIDQLESLGEALLDFNTVDDLREWLSRHSQQNES
ncbi:MAG: DUF4351 domain-containing protein [Leptolyngbyaceae bacterium]|nr:DUF4351 domain-containing protein [Leptolyngbyaceae bacterium]